MPFWILFCVSIAGGFVGALDGIGGGLILTPILVAFGVDVREAIEVLPIKLYHLEPYLREALKLLLPNFPS